MKKLYRVLKAALLLFLELPVLVLHKFINFLVIRDLKSRGIQAPYGTVVQGANRIFCSGKSYIGRNAVLWCGDHPHIKNEGGEIYLGNEVSIGDACNIRAAGFPVFIGDKVLIANGVTVVSSNHGILRGSHIVDQGWFASKGIHIEEDVWIGANAVILPGVTISKGAVVAAGAVVNKDVPEYEVWGGVPAKKISVRA